MSAPISKSTNVAGQPSDNDVRVNKELQDALQDFLSLDLEMLKNEAIPFETRTGAAKNATSKVLNAFNKLDPILNEFEVNKGSVSKETQDIHAALKDTKVQFKDLDVTLKNVKPEDADVDSFSFGGWIDDVGKTFNMVKKFAQDPRCQAIAGDALHRVSPGIWGVADTIYNVVRKF